MDRGGVVGVVFLGVLKPAGMRTPQPVLASLQGLLSAMAFVILCAEQAHPPPVSCVSCIDALEWPERSYDAAAGQ